MGFNIFTPFKAVGALAGGAVKSCEIIGNGATELRKSGESLLQDADKKLKQADQAVARFGDQAGQVLSTGFESAVRAPVVLTAVTVGAGVATGEKLLDGAKFAGREIKEFDATVNRGMDRLENKAQKELDEAVDGVVDGAKDLAAEGARVYNNSYDKGYEAVENAPKNLDKAAEEANRQLREGYRQTRG